MKNRETDLANNLILICGATGFIGRNMLAYFGSKPNTAIRAVYNERPPVDTSSFGAEVQWESRSP